jgi:hypothetical protein
MANRGCQAVRVLCLNEVKVDKANRKNSLLMTILLFISLVATMQFSILHFYKGFAEESNISVVEISTAKDLFKINGISNRTADFILLNDIDLAFDTSWQGYVMDYVASGFEPLNTINNKGTFDGCGFTISNINIFRNERYTGLFSNNALNIKNLFIENISLQDGISSGALAGRNTGTISNVHIINSNIESSEMAGGLIAENYGNLDNCSFEGNVKARTVGGLIGENVALKVANSYSDGNVIGHYAGGLIGNYGTDDIACEIESCYSSASVASQKYDETTLRIGGLIAVNHGDENIIKNSHSLDGLPAVASRDLGEATTLTTADFMDRAKLVGFDFDNHWAYQNGVLVQRTISVSSNTVDMNGTSVNVCGDKEYYLSGENAVLAVNKDNKGNIYVSGFIVDGGSVQHGEVAVNGYSYGTINKSIYLSISTTYMLTAEVKTSTDGGAITSNKKYYLPNEEIIIAVEPLDGYSFVKLASTHNGVDLTFEKIDDKTYKTTLTDTSFSYDSILIINGYFAANEQSKGFYWILFWIIFAVSVAAIVAVGVSSIIFLKRILRTKTV